MPAGKRAASGDGPAWPVEGGDLTRLRRLARPAAELVRAAVGR